MQEPVHAVNKVQLQRNQDKRSMESEGVFVT